MAKKSTANQSQQPDLAPLLRVVGRDLAASAQVAQATAALPQGLVVQPAMGAPDNDYAQIDLSLTITPSPQFANLPQAGMGYGGFTPQQRYHFLTWSLDVETPAPAAFRHLYLANLEVNLFDEPGRVQATKAHLLDMAQLPAWQDEIALARTLLLAFWLTQDGAGLSRWLATAPVGRPIDGLALGHLSLLHEKLQPPLVIRLANQWQLAQQLPAATLLQLRLASLATNLGAEPLQYALAQQPAGATAPKAWRSSHRDLRLALPQPDLRFVVEGLLREMLAAPTQIVAPAPQPSAAKSTQAASEEAEEGEDDENEEMVAAPGTNGTWHLILEFGESRSDLFQFALQHAQTRPGYVQMMDENRRMIHRVHFTKSELRRFWQLWDYVQSWAGTSVYLNGKELRKAEIYPYSPYMR